MHYVCAKIVTKEVEARNLRSGGRHRRIGERKGREERNDVDTALTYEILKNKQKKVKT